MGIHPTIDDERHTMVCGWVKVDGQWREIDKVYVNIGGQWREAFSGSPYYLYAPVGNKVVKLDYAGNVIWEYTNFDDAVRQVVVDSGGYVYAGGREDIHKINPGGTQAWKRTATDILKISAIGVGPDGSIYVSGYDSSVRKLNSAGTQVWKLSNLIEGNDIAVTSGGDIYVCGTRPNTESGVQLITSSGAAYRFIPIYINLYLANVATDLSNRVYVSRRAPSDTQPGSIERYDSAGGGLYTYKNFFQGFTVYGPAIVSGSHMYATDRAGYLHKLYIDDNNKAVWSKQINSGGAGVWLCATPDGYIWVVGGRRSLHKVDADGNIMFSVSMDATIEKIASDPGLYGTFPAAWN